MPRRLLLPDAGPGRPMACRETSAQESGTPVAPSRIIREGATGPMERSGGLAAARHHQSTATQAGTGQEQERNGVGTGVRQRRGTTGRRLRG